MSASIQCRRCGVDQPATEILKQCACGSRSYRILYKPETARHSYADSAGHLQFTDGGALPPAPITTPGDAHGPD